MPSRLIRNSITARLPARWAVIETVAAQTDIDLSLAGTTILFAVTFIFGQVALHAAVLGLGGSGHGRTLARVQPQGKFRW